MNHIEAMKQAHDMSLDGEHFAARQLLLETIADLEKQEPVAWTDELEIISKGIKDAIEENGGFWRSCTGCYETNEGYPPNGAYFSKVFKCYLGNGCDECGGIGAIWDDTDYEEMAEYMMQEDTHPQQKAEQEPVAWKLVPIKPTREMLEAMDECSIEGYDEHLYAGHAASVYMAAIDVAPTPPQPKELEQDEPVAGKWIVLSESVGKLKELGWNDEAIHKANTPQRKPLSDEEYSALAETYTGADGLDCVDFGRAVARHYGIKE